MSKKKMVPATQPTEKPTQPHPVPEQKAMPETSGLARQLAVFFAAFGFLLYVNTFSHGYALDDFSAMAKNSFVQKGLSGVAQIFGSEYRAGHAEHRVAGQLYRPLTQSFFALQWQIAPNSPGFYHFFNALCYALLAATMWLTWRKVFEKSQPVLLPALAVALFVAHPVHTEAVANIKSLDEILGLLFATVSLLWLWRFWEKNERKPLAFAVLAFAAAIFSKESSITFLAIFPLVGWFFAGKKPAELAKTMFWFALPVAAFLLLRASALAGQGATAKIFALDNILAGTSGLERAGTSLLFFGHYLWTLVVPHPLWSDLSLGAVQPVPVTDFRAIIVLVLLGLALWQIIAGLKKRALPAFALLWFFISFSISANLFFLIGTSYGERLAFVPSFGFSLLTAWVLTRFFSKKEMPTLHPAGWAVFGLLLGGYSIKTFLRNPDWKNDLTLLEADLPKAPNSARMNYHYALQLSKKMDHAGRKERPELKKVAEHCTKALEVFPDYHNVWQLRAWAFDELGDKKAALTDYKRYLEKVPDDQKVAQRIFKIYYEKEDFENAEKTLQSCLQNGQKSPDIYFKLGVVRARTNRFAEGIAAFENALKLDPKNEDAQRMLEQCQRDLAAGAGK